jgi:choline transporter-like protein 2/4/5
MGTLAFGSLITWICSIIEAIMKPMDRMIQYSSTMNIIPITYIRSLTDFFMSFVKYINSNAYTMCAIHGKAFCHSAKNAFNLIIRNVMQVVIIGNVSVKNFVFKIYIFFTN